MLTDYERQMCRDHKKRIDVQRTSAGQIAVKMAQSKRRERENRENILKKYIEPPAPPLKQELKVDPILERYMSK